MNYGNLIICVLFGGMVIGSVIPRRISVGMLAGSLFVAVVLLLTVGWKG